MIQKLKNVYHLIQSLIANIYYGFPAKKMTIIGVTGTDGKTTTTSMIYHLLNKSGLKCAMISTIYAKVEDEEIDTGLHVTTPEPWDLPRILHEFYQKGINYVVIESTSSGLDQNRLFGVEFDSCLITNIGHDHIDYHKTWENYAKAKFKIIRKTKKKGLVVLNKDHKSSTWLEKTVKAGGFNKTRKIKWFSQEDIQDTKYTLKGIQFKFRGEIFFIPVIGEYNFSNALASIKLSLNYISIEKIKEAFLTFRSPLGRMQIIQTSPFMLIIDFAHTPSGLTEALQSLNKLKEKSNKIFCVFGCPGQRDVERRKMGLVSAKMADVTVVTIEDPRIESLKKINKEIVEHAKKGGAILKKKFLKHIEWEIFKEEGSFQPESKTIYVFNYKNVQNRIDAIDFALRATSKGDIVFITGKGHEKTLAIGNPVVEYDYSDQKTVNEFLQRMNEKENK